MAIFSKKRKIEQLKGERDCYRAKVRELEHELHSLQLRYRLTYCEAQDLTKRLEETKALYADELQKRLALAALVRELEAQQEKRREENA